MQVYRWPEGPKPPVAPRLVAVGAFDGLHLGHQQVVRQLLAHAKEQGWLACLVTFEPVPAQVFFPGPPQNLRLTTSAERQALLDRFGLDELCLLDFSRFELRAMTAEAFIAQVLVEELGAVGLAGAANHTMGSDQQPWSTLADIAARVGLRVFEVPMAAVGADSISSTRIRELIWKGQVAEAAELIGRPYVVVGSVMKGTGTGRKLGFPTLNIDTPPDKLLPPDGVYCGWVAGEVFGPGLLSVPLWGRSWPAAVNIGRCPTRSQAAGNGDANGETAAPRTVEVHVVGWEGDAVGAEVVLGFIERLRTEQVFPSLDALAKQIGRDVRSCFDLVDDRYGSAE